MDYKKLKSGTDIRGTAIEGVIGDNITLTDSAICNIAKGFNAFLVKRNEGKKLNVAIGHDSRLSACRIKGLLIDTLSHLGVDVIDCGLSSTPAMFMILNEEDLSVDASIEITASHHPYNKNGLKFFLPCGGLESSDISEILSLAERFKQEDLDAEVLQGKQIGKLKDVELKDFKDNEGKLNCNTTSVDCYGKITKLDYMKRYAQILVDKARKECGNNFPLSGFKIVVDAGNGAGGFYAHDVLNALGADTSSSQFLEPDGNFPNHIPNPENVDAMKSIVSCVVKNKADLGLIFDTDVDRAGAVDRFGNEINRNTLIAMIAKILAKDNNGITIVTDSITSSGLKSFLEQNGVKHHRFKRGYKNVINEAIRLNAEGKNVPLAIETSGHAALAENFFLDDGAYLVTKLIIEMAKLKNEGKTLESLIESLSQPVESMELRLGFNLDDFSAYGKTVLKDVEEHFALAENYSLEKPNFEGVRVNYKNNKGWFLIRMSLHDPIMPVNIETDEKGLLKVIAEDLLAFLKNYRFLNFKALDELVNS